MTPDAPSVTLPGVRCAACGHTAFPRQDYGCEQCGAHGDPLHPADLRGSGTVVSAAVVHRHADPAVTTPFAAVSVVLDDGPYVVGLLADAHAATPGTRVHAVAGPDGDPRFVPDHSPEPAGTAPEGTAA